jgi:hypothetical protein
MATHETELTQPVDLCAADGLHLNPAALGWSRRPLHRTNLAGSWGRTKRWDYWAIQAEDVVFSATVADIDYLGLVAIGWIDLASHRSGGRTVARPLARGIELPETPCTGRLTHESRNLSLEVSYTDEAATSIRAEWTDRGGSPGSLDVAVAQAPEHESLNVVIPWSETCFQFTSKHQGRPATGTAEFDGRTIELGDGRTEAWGILDVGRGRWPYRTQWNWGGGAGASADGRAVGLQLGAKWTEGTGYTENGVLIDGRLTKIGDELRWDYSWHAPLDPWRVRSADGALDVTLIPVHDRHDRINAGVVSTEVHQVFGRWSGTVPDGEGGELTVDRIQGFAEESRSRW